MTYTDHFTHADDVITHLDTIVPTISDPLLQAKYVGFVAIASVTVYELAIKEVFITFSTKKHKVFGAFTEASYLRLNGRIMLNDLKKDHIKKFGEKYKIRFEKNLKKTSKEYLMNNKRDIRSSYGNLITWRHQFAHEGLIKTNATYKEIVQSYKDGKEVIRCLDETMRR